MNIDFSRWCVATLQNVTCRNISSTVGTTCSGYMEIPRTEIALKQAVAEIGPISAGIHVTNHSSFKQYKDGRLSEHPFNQLSNNINADVSLLTIIHSTFISKINLKTK